MLSNVPPTPPKMLINAVVAPSLIRTAFVAPPATPIKYKTYALTTINEPAISAIGRFFFGFYNR